MAKYKNTDLIFKDRAQAGLMLAEKLIDSKLTNPIIVALPRGGVAVAKPIAERLNAKLDIMVSKKIGAPGNPELAIGAVTSHGDYVIAPYADYELVDRDYIKEQIVYLANNCKEREKRYKSHSPDFPNRTIILVDDGTATGMTALAAIKSIKKQNPAYLILAIPVISSQAYDEIEEQIDKIETLKIPRDFIAVGAHFEEFLPVTDEEIKALLVWANWLNFVNIPIIKIIIKIIKGEKYG